MTTPRVTVPVEPTNEMLEAAESVGMTLAGSDMSSPDMTRHIWSAMLSAAPAPEGGAVDGPEDDELPGDFLARVGMDGALWADGFRKMALKLGYSDMDEGWLIGWFCNAVMAGYDHAQRRFDPALATREEAPAEAGDEGPCTCCDDTGWTIQTEQACSCIAGDQYRAQPPAREDGDDRPIEASWTDGVTHAYVNLSAALSAERQAWRQKLGIRIASVRYLDVEVPPAREEAQPVADAVEPIERAVATLKGHIEAIQVAKADGGSSSVITDCVNGLPEIVRWMESGLFSVEAAFEQYEDTHPAPDALRVAVGALSDLIENAVAARGCGLKNDPDGIVSSALFDTIMNGRQALVDLQAEQKGGVR